MFYQIFCEVLSREISPHTNSVEIKEKEIQ